MKSKVLFVDDEQNILNTLKMELHGCEFETLFLNNGNDAMQILGEEKISIVVSDLNMPEIDGVQLLEKVQEQFPDIIRIVLSSISDKKIILESINKGKIYQYIEKPWDIDNLKIIINKALNYYKINEERKILLKNTIMQNKKLEAWSLRLESVVDRRNKMIMKLRKKIEAEIIEQKKIIHRSLSEEKEQIRILIIDDVKNFTNMLRMKLNLEGYKKVTAINFVKEALENYEKNKYDVVFLDMLMPEINGEELFFKLRKINESIKVIFVTGKQKLNTERIIEDTGAYGIIKKPFEIDEIFDVLEKIIEQKI